LLQRRDSRRGEWVVACCEVAQQAGVRIGMPLSEAMALLDSEMAGTSWVAGAESSTPRCSDQNLASSPGLRKASAPATQTYPAQAWVLPEDPAADLVALGHLAERCDRFSPWVGWQTQDSAAPWFGDHPDHLFLDITGIPALFGGEELMGRRIISFCLGLGYTVLVAIAETIGAAWALTYSTSALTIVPTGELEPMVHPLSVGALRLPEEVLDKLAHLGIETIGQLSQLSRVGLAERFEADLILRLDQALGRAHEIIVPHRVPPPFHAALALDVPTDRRSTLEWILNELIVRIVEQLLAQGHGALQLVGRFTCSRIRENSDEAMDVRILTNSATIGNSVLCQFEINLFRPTISIKHLQDLIRLQCERLTWPGAVERVELQAMRTAPLEYDQGELFPDESQAVEQQLDVLLERLSSRLGADAVVKPELCADALPERAFHYVPLVQPRVMVKRNKRRRKALTKSVGPSPPSAVSERPLQLLPSPVQIQAVSVVPDGPPVAFHWQKQRYRIARHWGPERIETGWWRHHRLVRRDYYRVETETGNRMWLFRDLKDGTWYLHGCFE